MFRQSYRGWNRKSKYGAVKATYEGTAYDSGMERTQAWELAMQKKAGAILDFKPHVTIPLYVGKYHVCDYKIDFVVDHLDGTKEYLEVKGFETRDWKLKWKLFEALYSDLPNVKLTVVKQMRRY